MTTSILSPWLTVQEAATYSRRHAQTLYTALRQYRSSHGRRGLRGSQNGDNCAWRIQRVDLDAWMEGQAPTRRKPR